MPALSRDQPAPRTCQEHEARRHLARQRRPARRQAGGVCLRLGVRGCAGLGYAHSARADGVHADAVLGMLVGKVAREADDGAAGGGVVEHVGMADVWVGGGVGDDGVAGGHLRGDVFGEEEEGVDVAIECGDPLVATIMVRCAGFQGVVDGQPTL